MKNKLFDVFIWVITLVFVGSIFTMSDIVPVHWNMNWEVDRYGSRYNFLIVALLPIFTYYGMLLTKNIDPNKKKFFGRENV